MDLNFYMSIAIVVGVVIAVATSPNTSQREIAFWESPAYYRLVLVVITLSVITLIAFSSTGEQMIIQIQDGIGWIIAWCLLTQTIILLAFVALYLFHCIKKEE